MELPGTSYLYTVATISITFGGFSALVVIFRQALGGGLSNYDIFFIQGILIRSFIVTACALLPPWLAFFELSHSIIWRVSSLIAALLQGALVLSWRARRRAVTDVPVLKWAYVNYGLQLGAAIFLLMIALGIFEPGPGPFVGGITACLFLSGTAYLILLKTLLRGPSKGKRRR